MLTVTKDNFTVYDDMPGIQKTYISTGYIRNPMDSCLY